jgi:hypothetical protein
VRALILILRLLALPIAAVETIEEPSEACVSLDADEDVLSPWLQSCRFYPLGDA